MNFQAHESAIKCLAIDPHEEIFATGSADGDIKVSILEMNWEDIMKYIFYVRFRFGVWPFTLYYIRIQVSISIVVSLNI